MPLYYVGGEFGCTGCDGCSECDPRPVPKCEVCPRDLDEDTAIESHGLRYCSAACLAVDETADVPSLPMAELVKEVA